MTPEGALEYLKEAEIEKREASRHEYSEVFLNIRHYSSLRFAMLTVFAAMMGGLVGAAFNAPGVPALAAAFKVLGVIAGFVFWWFEERVNVYQNNLNRRARALERALNYEQTLSLPAERRWRADPAFTTRVLYAAVVLFWIFWLIFPSAQGVLSSGKR